jgi:hypothetical protein
MVYRLYLLTERPCSCLSVPLAFVWILSVVCPKGMRRVEWSRGVAVMVLGFLLSLSLILLLVGSFLTPVRRLYLLFRSLSFCLLWLSAVLKVLASDHRLIKIFSSPSLAVTAVEYWNPKPGQMTWFLKRIQRYETWGIIATNNMNDQLDATITIWLVFESSQHVSGNLLPIFSSVRLWLQQYGVLSNVVVGWRSGVRRSQLQRWTIHHTAVTTVLRCWRWAKDCPKHVELIQRPIKLLLLHLVGHSYYSPIWMMHGQTQIKFVL